MTPRSLLKCIVPVLAAAFLAGCATGPREGLAANDPFESFNRTMLQGNKRLDQFVLRPVAKAYDVAVPETLQFILSNELDYLSTPVDFANYMLQGRFEQAGVSLARFTINTVMGGVGLLDPATELGLPKDETDFGVTLGRWGVPEGPFLMLPLLGPATARELPAFVVDRAFSPLTYAGYVGPFQDADGLAPGARLLGIIDTRSDNADLIDQLLYETEDPYVTLRSAYLQRRRAMVAGPESVDNLPDIFDDQDADAPALEGQAPGVEGAAPATE